LARRSVTVTIAGDGADEVFGGYRRYRLVRDLERFLPRSTALRQAASRVLRMAPYQLWQILFRTLRPIVPALRQRTAALDMYRIADLLRQPSADAVYAALMGVWNPEDHVVDGEEDVAHSAELAAPHWPLIDRLMWFDTTTYLSGDILVKVDRATMSVGLEARAPFLDHRVVEFAWRLPSAMKIRGSTGKWILRQLLARYLPAGLVSRPKKGFGVPIGAWLRGPLRPWAEELLNARRIRGEGYLNAEAVRRKWAEHLTGTHNWTPQLWSVLMFQAWLEHTNAQRLQLASAAAVCR
jgi:asparagine synthase (glutamine-hydrolysing)